MDNRLPVLIVGAGPTGLTMACELARHGVPFRIIDKKPERTLTSNATWIQTRTIEWLDHIGMAGRFLEAGHRCTSINFYIDGQHLFNVPFNDIDSFYRFVLMLPQSETERLLEERLNELENRVERSLELIDVKQTDHEVQSTIKFSDGRTDIVKSDWLVACDGANSMVREKCHLLFQGEDITEQFMVADAQIESYMSKNEIHMFFDNETIFVAFPMNLNKYRVAANLHLTHRRKIFTEKEVIDIVQERAHGAYYVKNISWVSPFWIHGKIVKEMRCGSIFLAGDAAHIHSPAGGQGMNTGIQDAYNLGWKLALVLKGKANISLLDSYQAERHPIVNEIVEETEHFTKMALFDPSFLKKLRQFKQKFSRNPVRLSKEMSTQITQLGIQYRNSPVIDYKNITNGKSPRQGERAPDVMINPTTRLYDYLRNTWHHVLFFSGLKIEKNELIKIKELQQWINQTYPDLIKATIIMKEKLFNGDNIISDERAAVHDHYHIKTPVIYIIRPDHYIGYYSKRLDQVSIKKFFNKYLN